MKAAIASMRESAVFQSFMERIQEKAEEWNMALRSGDDTGELFRAQGALNFFEYVKDLPDMMIREEETPEEEEE